MYAKLYGSIVTSSVWAEDLPTRVLWVTMLALADQDGFVRCVESRLGAMANLPESESQASLTRLEAPDPMSSDPENDGRRIARVPGGWQILNYKKYRSLRDPERRREQTRRAVAKYRAKKAAGKPNVSSGNQKKAQAEAEADIKEKTIGGFDAFWAAYPRRAGNNPKRAAEAAYVARLNEGVDPVAILAGVERYTAFLKATGKIGTEFVKQAQFWLAPKCRGWEEPWAAPDDLEAPAFPNYPVFD